MKVCFMSVALLEHRFLPAVPLETACELAQLVLFSSRQADRLQRAR